MNEAGTADPPNEAGSFVNRDSELERDLRAGLIRFDPEEQQFLRTSSWYPVNLDAILDGDAPEERPTWFLRSDGVAILYPGRSHVFYGPSESLKSWAALAAAASVIESGRSVFYID